MAYSTVSINNSTLRFWARFSVVSLGASGLVSA